MTHDATRRDMDERPGAARLPNVARPSREETVWAWLGPGLGLLFALASALYWGGRYVDVEALGFLEHYWGEGSVLQRILDPRAVDFYRGRELSYAVDFIDAQWMRLLFEHGVFFFLAPSALLACFALVGVHLRLASRALPGLRTPVRWLGLLVLLSNFVFLSTMGIYYRSTKILLAPLLLALLLLVLAEVRDPRLGPRAGFGAVLGLTLAMSLLDRQGLFFALVTTLALGALWVAARRGAALALGGLTALGVWTLYNHGLGPVLIRAVNGYWPDMDFQRLRPGSLTQASLWAEAVKVLGDWTSVLLAGLPPAVLGVAAVAGAAAWGWSERRRPRRLLAVTAGTLAVSAAVITMVALMLERHPPVAWTGNRLWYYPLSFQVFAVVALLWSAEGLAARGWGRSAVPVVLAAVVAGNVALWSTHDLRMHSTPAFAEQKRQAGLLVESLEGRASAASLAGHDRRFYFDALDRFPRLAERAAPQVSEGAGMALPEIRDGRLMAWSGRESQIVTRTAHAGPHVLAGGAILRPDERLLVLLGAERPRLLAEVRGEPAQDGPVFFRLVAELGAGLNDVRLVSQVPERRVPGGRFRASFALLLPVALWPTPDDGDRTQASPSADGRAPD